MKEGEGKKAIAERERQLDIERECHNQRERGSKRARGGKKIESKGERGKARVSKREREREDAREIRER